MPIILDLRPEPFSRAHWKPEQTSKNQPLLIESAGSKILIHEMRRYVAGEINGRSFLVSGHRGAGKTTLVAGACHRVHEEIIRERQPRRPFLVLLHGPNLLGDERREQESAPQGQPQPSKTFTDRILERIAVGLYRALLREFAVQFRNRLGERRWRHSTHPAISHDDLELSARFELELDSYPVPARLREFWARSGLLSRGVLFREFIDRPLLPEDQGLRELVALSSASGIYRRVSGTTDAKLDEIAKEGEAEEVETKSEGGKLSELFAPISSLLLGGTAASAAGLADQELPVVAFAGFVTALLSSFTFRFSSSHSRSVQQETSLTFTPDLGITTLDRELPKLVDRLMEAGLAPVFMIDELDKVLEKEKDISDVVRRLKKLVAEEAFFCFLTDRNYYEKIEQRVLREAYPQEYTYFTYRLFVIFSQDQIHDYVALLLRPFELSSEELTDLTLLPYVLLQRSRMHPFTLRGLISEWSTQQQVTINSASQRATLLHLPASPRELLSKVVDGASGGDLILPDSVDEFHIFNDLSQAAVAW